MDLADRFKIMFEGVDLEIEDLFLLESFQIAYFPGWVPEKEFAVVLMARPELGRYLVNRCPEIAAFIDSVMEAHGGSITPEQLLAAEERVVWTLADILVYNKCPGVYDKLEFHYWDFSEVTSVVDLTGKIVMDVGSGTGRVALEAAETAKSVYAVEPVSRLRQFIRDKAHRKGLTNVFVVDGFLHAMPFPDAFADVILTSHALGWQLEDELREFERVCRPGGTILHCPGTADDGPENTDHQILISRKWGYQVSTYVEPPAVSTSRRRKYWKRN